MCLSHSQGIPDVKLHLPKSTPELRSMHSSAQLQFTSDVAGESPYHCADLEQFSLTDIATGLKIVEWTYHKRSRN